jgi:hypothetical protein
MIRHNSLQLLFSSSFIVLVLVLDMWSKYPSQIGLLEDEDEYENE